jgi:hypothetical protein
MLVDVTGTEVPGGPASGSDYAATVHPADEARFKQR